MHFRVEATVQGRHGNNKVVATNAFGAKPLTEAEEISDDWAKGQRIFGASTFGSCKAR
jgi:hypothetical protein